MALTADKLHGNRLFLRTEKTGVNVFVPLPPQVVAELNVLPKYGGYFFWKREGESKVDTATGNARRALRKIFKHAGIKRGHPHRFRDTFSVSLFEKGASVENVATLLGNSAKVCAKHYAPWVKSLQDNLEREVAKTWDKPALVRVK
jgi:integrase